MYDVTIVGGGIVGLLHAVLLAQHTPLNIALLSQQPLTVMPAELAGPSVYAIVPSTQRILRDVGVWPELLQQGLGLIKDMLIWDTVNHSKLLLTRQEVNVRALAYVVAAHALRNCLIQRLHCLAQVTILAPWHFLAWQETATHLVIECQEGSINTQLLVGADGAESAVRHHGQFKVVKRGYGHSALITQVATTVPHRHCAQQFFVNNTGLPVGPLAFLPLADAKLAAIVWSVVPDQAQRLLSLPTEALQEILERASLQQFAALRIVKPLQVLPLYERRVVKYYRDRVVLLGDAAHTVHPLAGQGLNLGIADAAFLAKVLGNAVRQGRCFYNSQTLAAYEHERRAKNELMLKAIGFIKIIFTTKVPGISCWRRQGWHMLNRLPLMKKIMVRYAMGDKLLSWPIR
jgi:2-octaprenylphenol hydroxylase